MMIIEATIPGWLTPALQLPVVFRYTPDDPAVIHLIFMDYSSEKMWIIGREIMARGLDDRAGGLMDVEVYSEGSWVNLVLSSPGQKPVTVKFDRVAVAQFIYATFKVVPHGREYEIIDWDRELQNLLE